MNSPSVRPILSTPPRKSVAYGVPPREQFFRTLLESLSDRLCVLDRNGTVVYINCGRGAFSAAPKDPMEKLALGTNYLITSEAAVRNGILLARERLNGVLAVLQRRLAHFELRYPCSSSDDRIRALMTILPMPEEHGGVIVRLLDVGGEVTSSGPDKHEVRERTAMRVAQAAVPTKPCGDERSLCPPGGNYGWSSDATLSQFHPVGSDSGRSGSPRDVPELYKLEQARGGLDRRLLLAQEEERKRIARELHDDISQSLALSVLTLDQILQELRKLQSPVRSQMVSLRQNLGTIASDVHRISHNLYPSRLVQLGLVPALRRLLKDFSAHQEIDVALHSGNIPSDIPQQTTIGLFRIAQECLNNIAKHSGAHSATLTIKGTREGIELTVSDTGVGFDTENLEESSGLGIRNMQERACVAGGRLKIKSSPRCGTTVSVWIGTS